MLCLLIFVKSVQVVCNFIMSAWSNALVGCSVNACHLTLKTGALFMELSCDWPGVQDIP